MGDTGRTSTYQVVGMACRGCASTVTEEVQLVNGVTSVTVDVASGSLTVTSERGLPPTAVRAAVEAAGYGLTPP